MGFIKIIILIANNKSPIWTNLIKRRIYGRILWQNVFYKYGNIDILTISTCWSYNVTDTSKGGESMFYLLECELDFIIVPTMECGRSDTIWHLRLSFFLKKILLPSNIPFISLLGTSPGTQPSCRVKNSFWFVRIFLSFCPKCPRSWETHHSQANHDGRPPYITMLWESPRHKGRLCEGVATNCLS